MIVRKKMSISRVFLYNLIFVALVSILTISFFWVKREYDNYNQKSELLSENFMNAQKYLVRNEVEKVVDDIHYEERQVNHILLQNVRSKVLRAYRITENIYRSAAGKYSRREIKKLVKSALEPFSRDNNISVFYVVDKNGFIQISDDQQKHEGSHYSTLKDTTVKSFIHEILSRLHASGNRELVFEKELKRNASIGSKPKVVSFIKYFEPLGWYIGSGDHTDHVIRNIQFQLLNRIAKIRFGNGGYVFVNTYDGKALVFHGEYKREPPDNWELTDPSGIKVVQEQRRVVENPDGGFIYYTFRKLNDEDPKPKVSFIKGIPEWKWMVGAGVYLDGIEAILAKEKEQLQQSLSEQFIKIAIILLLTLVSIGVIVRYMSFKAKTSFEIFSRFFRKAASESSKIKKDDVHFSEFTELAELANEMVDKRLASEKEKKELQKRLVRSKKMESLGLLAGGVAHDLNNLLSGLVTYPELLLMEIGENSHLQKSINVIRDAGMRAAAIVQDLLTITRGVATNKEPLNVNKIIDEYFVSPEYEKLRERFPKLQIDTELEPELLNINGSYAHIRKTLDNLLINAAEAIGDTGTILLKTQNINLDKKLDLYESVAPGDYVVITIEDDGKGIPKEDIEHIFEPFYTKKKMGKSGTGLGLAVVWNTIRDHDGYIDVESDENGTRFSLYFPVTYALPEMNEGNSKYEEILGRGEKILVVDDVHEQRLIVCRILEKLGYEATSVSGGEEAVEFVKNNPVDLVLLDMIMDPGMNGLQTYRKLLEIQPGIRAVITSGYSETGDVRKAQLLGAGRFVKKPYSIENLGRAVREELESAVTLKH